MLRGLVIALVTLSLLVPTALAEPLDHIQLDGPVLDFPPVDPGELPLPSLPDETIPWPTLRDIKHLVGEQVDALAALLHDIRGGPPAGIPHVCVENGAKVAERRVPMATIQNEPCT